MQRFRFREHRRLGTAEFTLTVVAQQHMLQQDQAFPAHSGFFRHLVQVGDAADQVTQQLSVPGIVRDVAGLVALHFLNLAQIVNDHAGHQQIPVQPGVNLQHRVRQPEHIRGVMQQAAAFRVVHPLCGRKPSQPVSGQFQHSPGQLLQVFIREALNCFLDICQHIFRFPRCAGNQRIHIHRVVVRAQPPFFNPQLQPSVILLDRSANLDRLSGFRSFRFRIPVPDLAVDLACPVRQIHIHIIVAFAVLPLLRGTDEQESFIPHVPLQLANRIIIH